MKSMLPKAEKREKESSVSDPIPLTYSRLLPSMKQVYGMDLHSPHRNDINLYKRYAGMASSCKAEPSNKNWIYRRMVLVPKSAFTVDNTIQVTTPFVDNSSLSVYFKYAFQGGKSCISTSQFDLNLYRRYASS